MFKPMLAPNNDPLKDPNYFKLLRYPLAGSPKLDGIRNITKDFVCKSRKFIDLPSRQVQEHFSNYLELDGEIIIGNETDFDVYNRTQSYVMSMAKDADPADVHFRVFDCADPYLANEPFMDRLEHARKLVKEYNELFGFDASIVEHKIITCYDELIAYEEEQLALGYEGIMMRDPVGRYKHGRGTFLEGLIYKLKRFSDGEALVVDILEKETNLNPNIKDAFGNAKRSTAKENLVGAGTAGTFVCLWENNVTIDVAPGAFTHAELQEIWDNKDRYIGKKWLKYRHFKHGQKDAPRFARAVGWRDPMDM